VSEAAKKAWRTRERKKTGKRVAEHRKRLMYEVKELLRRWNKRTEGKEICSVCGDGTPKTILQRHHTNPFDKSEGEIWLCASCHNIFNKITETTKSEDVIRDFRLRHKRFDFNIKWMRQELNRVRIP